MKGDEPPPYYDHSGGGVWCKMLYRYEVKVDTGDDIEAFGFFSKCGDLNEIANAISSAILGLSLKVCSVEINKKKIKEED